MGGSGERKRMEKICFLIKQQLRVKVKTMPGVQPGQLGGSGALLANKEHRRKSSIWRMIKFCS